MTLPRRPPDPRIRDHRRSRLPRPPPPACCVGRLAALALAGCTEAAPPPPSRTVVTPEQAKSGFRTSEELTRYADVT
jgi:hypothetical protein